MWYGSLVPEKLPDGAVEAAEAAVEFAQSVRRVHARRTDKGSPNREDDIANALARLKAAMDPLKREIARFPYGPQTDQAEQNRQRIRTASQAIQRERRKLWKMQQR